jgi:hypothetical protein
MTNSRSKGRAGEREFLNQLGELLDQRLDRNLEQSHSGGADCVCIDGWAIEIKRVERSQFPTWWWQAQRQAARIKVRPALAWRRNRVQWRVWLSADKSKSITLEEFASVFLGEKSA